MTRTSERKALLLDLAFASGLLVTAALWLVVFRYALWIHTWPGLAAFGGVFAALVVGWKFVTGRSSGEGFGFEAGPAPPQSRLNRFLLMAWLWIGLLLLTDVVFYQPLKIHFWGGYDDFVSLTKAPLWNSHTDAGLGRPFNTLPCQIALWLTPERVEGSLWVATALCFFNSLLVFSIIRRVTPGAVIPALVAAVLLMVNRSDDSRFFVMWTTNFYWAPLCSLLAAFWLFLVSYQRQSRPLLVLSCGFLASTFLMSEGAFPLSVLGLVLLWLIRRERHLLWVWAFSWSGTVAVMAARLVLTLMKGRESYQAKQAAGALHDPSIFLGSLKLHVTSIVSYFSGFAELGKYWPWAVAAFLLGALLFAPFISREKEGSAPTRRQYVVGMIVGAAALFLGALPFLHMLGLFRTAFLSAPGQAVLIAFAMSWVGTFLPKRLSYGLLALGTCVLASVAVVAEFRDQNNVHELSSVSFEKTVHIFDQIHGLSPRFPVDSVILCVLEESNRAFFGANYSSVFTSKVVLDVPAVQMNVGNLNPLDCKAVFAEEGVAVKFQNGRKDLRDWYARYDRVAAFRVSQDGTVMFLGKFPPGLRPQNSSVEYHPLAFMKPGPITPMPYMRYCKWMEPVRDVLDTNPGVMMDARHWGPREVTRDKMYREVVDGAEIALNSMGESQRKLVLSVRPPKEHTGPWTLQALDPQGKVAASATLAKHQDVTLTLPMDPEKIGVYSLRLWETAALAAGKAPEPIFRIYCRKLKSVLHQTGSRDIGNQTVQFGENWHDLERSEGELYRWVANDAEITLSPFAPDHADLMLTVQPGPGMSGSPCHLQLLDSEGHSVGEVTFDDRRALRIPLPKPLKRDTPYRLHVLGGGAPSTNGDPRILNFRVFECVARE